MPKWPLCLSALLALMILGGCSSDTRVAKKGCHAVVLDRLDHVGVELAEVKKISYSRQTEGGDNNDRIIGWDAWVRFHSCPGALIVDMTSYCYVRQIYTRDGCVRPGLPHFP